MTNQLQQWHFCSDTCICSNARLIKHAKHVQQQWHCKIWFDSILPEAVTFTNVHYISPARVVVDSCGIQKQKQHCGDQVLATGKKMVQ
jgi:hypothetical protein